MADFDPDAFLAGKQDASVATLPPPSDFDPDKFLGADAPKEKLKQSMYVASQRNPDEHAKALDLSAKTGVPVSLIDKDTISSVKEKSIQRNANDNLLNTNPRTAEWLQHPDNSSVSHDDIPNIQKHEQIIQSMHKAKNIEDAWKAGYQGSLPGLIERGKMPDTYVDEDAGILMKAANIAGGLLPDIPFMMGAGKAGAIAGAAGGGAIGTAIAPGPGTAIGAGVGGILAGGYSAFAVPHAAKEALISSYTQGPIKDAHDLVDRTWHITKEANKQGLVGIAAEISGGVFGVVAKGVVGKGVSPLAGEVFTAATKPFVEAGAMTNAGAMLDGREASAEEYVTNLATIGILHAPRSYKAIMGQARVDAAYIHQERARQREQNIKDVHETSKESKLLARSPKAYETMLEAQTKNTGLEHTYIPVEKLTEYLTKKNIDIPTAMDQLGATESYKEAAEHGGYVKFSTAKFMTTLSGTEHIDGLLKDMKNDQFTEKTTNEAKDEADQVKKELEALAKEAEANAESDGVDFTAETKNALMSTGRFSDQEAQDASALHIEQMRYLSQETGTPMAELMQQFQLSIDPGEQVSGDTVLNQAPLKPEELAIANARIKEIDAKLGNKNVSPEERTALIHEVDSIYRKTHGVGDVIMRSDATPPKMEMEQIQKEDHPLKYIYKDGNVFHSPEEYQDHELHTDPITRINNLRAFERDAAMKWPTVSAIDMDGLTKLNDDLGHLGTNKVMKLLGDTLKEFESKNKNVKFYHRHGDEFAARFISPEHAEEIMKELQAGLDKAYYEVPSDGKMHTRKGIGISYGNHESYDLADKEAYKNKEQRLESGIREPKDFKGKSHRFISVADLKPGQADAAARFLRQTPGGVTESGPEGGGKTTLFQSGPKPNALGFYSQLEHEISKMDFKEMPAKDLLGRIQNIPGIKKEELEYSGVIEFLNVLNEVGQKVTKDRILEVVKGNGLVLKQVVQGEVEAPKKIRKQNTNEGDGLLRPDDVTWNEETLSADDIDPGGNMRSENSYERAREDWRHNREDFEELIGEIEGEIKADNPGIDEVKLASKVEEAFMEKRSDAEYEYETSEMDSGDSVYSRTKYTIEGIDEDLAHIEGSPDYGFELYINGRHKKSGDLMLLQQQAIEALHESGDITTKPRPVTVRNQVHWSLENGNPVVRLHFDNGESAIAEIEKENDIYHVKYRDVLKEYGPGDDPLDATTLEEAKDEVLDKLEDEYLLLGPDENAPAEPEKLDIPIEPSINTPTKSSRHKQFTLAGGENYREFLLQLPPQESYQPGKPPRKHYTGGHFEADTLVHVRATDRTTEDGKKVLFVEEIQSDWHQQGREGGYDKGPPSPEMVAKAEELTQQIIDLEEKEAEVNKQENQAAADKYKAQFEKENAELHDKIKDAKEKRETLLSEQDAIDKEYRKSKTHGSELYSKYDDAKKEAFSKLVKAADIFKSKALNNFFSYNITKAIERSFEKPKLITKDSYKSVVKYLAGDERLDSKEIKPYNAALKKAYSNPKFVAKLNKLQKEYGEVENKRLKCDESRADSDAKYKEMNNKRRQADELETYIDSLEYKAGSLPEYLKTKKLIDRTESTAIRKQWQALQAEKNIIAPDYAVPDAPFKSSNQWMSLALKRMLSVAQQENFDMLAWAPGKVHVDRYNQARYLENISYYKEGEEYHVIGKTLKGATMDAQGPFTKDQLAGAVGKQIAEKIIAGEGAKPTEDDISGDDIDYDKLKTLKDKDLMIGDTGHIELYDTILKNAARDVLKKIDKEAKVTVKNATEEFGGELEESPHSMRNKDDNHKYNEFWAIDLSPGLKNKIAGGLTLFQPGADDTPRGQIEFNKDLSQFLIKLSKSADPSTAIHEFTHYQFKLMGALAKSEKASSKMGEDYKALLDWVGAKDGETLSTEQEEMIARGFEAYMFEGKAPNSKLEPIFERFKKLLLKIYKNLKALKIELTDNVRSVFDSWLTAEAEVSKAQGEMHQEPMFGRTGAYKMSDKRAEAYYDAVESARSVAEGKVTKKIMDAYRKEKSAEYAEQRSVVRERVEKEVSEQQIYKVIDTLQKGKNEDGSPIKLSKDGIIKIWGADGFAKIKDMPGPYIYAREGGMLPDEAASYYGFRNGDALLTQILNTPPKDTVIDNMTDQVMDQMHPDPAQDGTLPQEAMDAIHNDKRAQILRMELEELAENHMPVLKDVIRTISRRVPPDKVVREQATKIIDNKIVGELSPHVYLLAEQKAAKLAGESLAKGDLDAAFENKQRELLNHELYRSAVEARNYINKKMQKFKKLARPDEKVAKSRDVDLINAARSLLALHGIGKPGKSPVEYLSSLKKYDEDAYNNIEAIVKGASENPGPFKEKSYAEFVDLAKAVDALDSLSKSMHEIDHEGKKLAVETAVNTLTSRLDAFKSNKKHKDNYDRDADERSKTWHGLLSVKAMGRRYSHWITGMDGGLKGEFRNLAYQNLSDAKSEYDMVRSGYHRKFNELAKKIKPTMSNKEIKAPEFGFAFKNKSALLGAIRHIGNSSNKKKLLVGRGWGTLDADGNLDSSKWDQFLDRMFGEGVITKADMDFIQAYWDLNEELKPAAQKAHHKIFGYYFNEITREPVKTPFGTYAGGYVPAKIDPNPPIKGAARAHEVADKQKLEEMTKGHVSYTWPAGGGSGFGKNRVENFNKPLSLDMNSALRHIDEVLRFTYLKPAVIDAAKIVLNPEFRHAMNDVDSAVINELILPALNRMDKDSIQSFEGHGPAYVAKMANHMKNVSAMQLMFANIPNMVEQFTGAVPAISVIGGNPISDAAAAVRVSAAGAQYMLAPRKMTAEISSKSKYMKSRFENHIFDLEKATQDIFDPRSKFKTLQDFAAKHVYIGQIMAQNGLDSAIWSAAYSDGIAKGMKEKEAVNRADTIVSDTQGTMRPLDVSRIDANPFMRIFQMFYGYFNNLINLNATSFKNLYHEEMGLPKKVAKGFYLYWMQFASVAVLSALLKSMWSGKNIDEDGDGEVLDDAFDMAWMAQIKQAAASLPGGAPVMAGLNRYNKKPFDDRTQASPAVDAISNLIALPGNIYEMAMTEKDLKKQNVRDTMSALGLLTGLPIGTAAKPINYLRDVKAGRAEPSGPIDFTRGLVTGQPGQ